MDARRLRAWGTLGFFVPRPLSRGVREDGNGLLRLLRRRPPSFRRADAPARGRDLGELQAPGPSRLRAGGIAPPPPARRPRLRRRRDVHLLEAFTSRHGACVPPLRPGRVRPGGECPRRGGWGRIDGRRRLFRGRERGGVPPRFRVRAAPGVSVPGAGPPRRRDAGVLLEEMPVLPRGGCPHSSVPGGGRGDVPRAAAGVVRSVRHPAVSPDGQRDPGRRSPVDGGPGKRAARHFVARVRPLRAGTARAGVRLVAGRGGLLDASAWAGERLAAASRSNGKGDARRRRLGDPVEPLSRGDRRLRVRDARRAGRDGDRRGANAVVPRGARGGNRVSEPVDPQPAPRGILAGACGRGRTVGGRVPGRGRTASPVPAGPRERRLGEGAGQAVPAKADPGRPGDSVPSRPGPRPGSATATPSSSDPVRPNPAAPPGRPRSTAPARGR